MNTDTLEAELTFAQKAQHAHERNAYLIDTVELDGISYVFHGYPYMHKGDLRVVWYIPTDSRISYTQHSGQQGFISYRKSRDFGSHHDCNTCEPQDFTEEQYWAGVRSVWENEMRRYGVTEWNPDIVF